MKRDKIKRQLDSVYSNPKNQPSAKYMAGLKRVQSKTYDNGQIKFTETKLKGGKLAWDFNCSQCGEELTVINKYGMFCKHRHGEKEAKEGYKKLGNIMKAFMSLGGF